MDYTHIFTDGSNDGVKTAAAFICQSFEFSKRLPDKASIFTAELEAIVSDLRYIKITHNNNKFVVFCYSVSIYFYMIYILYIFYSFPYKLRICFLIMLLIYCFMYFLSRHNRVLITHSSIFN